MRIVICDDEIMYIRQVEDAIDRWKEMRNIYSIYVTAYNSSEDLTEAIGQNLPYDMAFLDIQFPGEMSGLDTAQILRNRNEFMTLVLMTNYQEYAIEGYKVSAQRFLTKPLDEKAIWECLDIAHNQWELMNDKSLIISGSGQSMRIPYKNIMYAESRAHYAIIYRAKGENISVRMKLSDIMAKLPEKMFIQCHRSYMVNLLHISSIQKGNINMTNGDLVPVSPRLWAKVHRQFSDFYLGGDYGYRIDNT